MSPYVANNHSHPALIARDCVVSRQRSISRRNAVVLEQSIRKQRIQGALIVTFIVSLALLGMHFAYVFS